jgi:hypothetical protein
MTYPYYSVPATRLPFDDDDLHVSQLSTIAGGKACGQLVGIKALMLAVLENGIRSFFSDSRSLANEAERWIYSHGRQSPFAFAVVCEMLSLDPGPVRKRLWQMKGQNLSRRKAISRARHNVRIPGRVRIRETS